MAERVDNSRAPTPTTSESATAAQTHETEVTTTTRVTAKVVQTEENETNEMYTLTAATAEPTAVQSILTNATLEASTATNTEDLRKATLKAKGALGPINYSAKRTLAPGFLADVAWWTNVMPLWNGVAIIPPLLPDESPAFHFETDASTEWGYGAWCGPFFYFWGVARVLQRLGDQWPRASDNCARGTGV